MGLAYLFALVVSLGLLALQVVLSGREVGGEAADHDVDHDADHDGNDGHDAHGALAMFLSVRFWTFFALGFGMSGSLLHFLALAPAIAVFLIATFAGAGSGTFAALAFRALKRASTNTEARSSQAVGRIARVVVPCGRGLQGQVRIEIGGASVDLVATTDEIEIARGEAVIVEDVQDNVARVSRRPDELS
jgi:membrane protein implicated in regulation of membrane protease activity